ncbi:hypothetical protein SBRCBS47491_002980 [Sporothrix bragantina]|uniref:Major facilitator superfamily (MFS) profile domain-containing protein n=1 Tax=Sporothrix bragantina TaxID=671064 RepID=A0ABP0BBC3_9PEZI
MSTKDASMPTHIESSPGMEKQGNVSAGGDDGLAFVLENGQDAWTEEEEKRVLRKIDSIILPLLFIAALFLYADAQAYGIAAIFGLVQDLGLYSLSVVDGAVVLDLSRYSMTACIYYLGAVAGMYPLLLLAQRLPIGRFLGGFIIFIGTLALLTITCHDYAGILTLRFFFGFQSVLTPLCIIITAMWWKTSEQPLRTGVWSGGAAIGNLCGQAIDLGAIHIGGVYAASPWKWLYVVLGSIALGLGAVVFAIFPNGPTRCWFLNDRERMIAVNRLLANNTGIHTKKFKRAQFVEVFKDPQTYCLSIYNFAFAFANSALGSFGGLLTSSFGYSNTQSLQLLMPASAVAIVSIAISAKITINRFQNRRVLISTLFILPSIAGNALLWKASRTNKGALLAGLYMSAIFYGVLPAMSAIASANIAGHTKKTTLNSVTAIFAACGSFAGPWAYKGSEEAEGYPTAQTVLMSLFAICAVTMGVLEFCYRRRNRIKALKLAELPAEARDPLMGFRDMTDFENPLFVYTT